MARRVPVRLGLQEGKLPPRRLERGLGRAAGGMDF